ncbi:hypothetical protein ACLB2K_049509 [Fragaria x ananassa]
MYGQPNYGPPFAQTQTPMPPANQQRPPPPPPPPLHFQQGSLTAPHNVVTSAAPPQPGGPYLYQHGFVPAAHQSPPVPFSGMMTTGSSYGGNTWHNVQCPPTTGNQNFQRTHPPALVTPHAAPFPNMSQAAVPHGALPPPPPQAASTQSPAPPLPTTPSPSTSLQNLDPDHGSNKLPLSEMRGMDNEVAASNNFEHFTSVHEGSHNVQGGSEFEKAGSLARDGVSSNGSVMLNISSPPPKPSDDIVHKIDSICQLSAMNEGKIESPSKSSQIDSSSQPDQFMVSSGYSLPADSDMEMEDDITLSDGNQEVHNSSDTLNRTSDINHGELDVKKHLHGAQSSLEWTDPQGISFEKVPSSLSECQLIIQGAPSRVDICPTGASESPLASQQEKSSIPKADDRNKLDASAAAEATNSDGFSNHITVNSPFRLLQDYASENSSEDGDVGIPPSSVTTNVKSSAKDAGSQFESQEGKKTKSECLPKVDEYGRLVREGFSDSNSDGSRYNKRRKRGRSRSRSRSRKRSHSRSRSPLDSRRRRSPPRRSPPRRREKRNRSPSWSSRNQRGRSRSPTFRRAGEFRDENKRQDRRHIPECFDFLRGKCSRGGSCRYMHSEHDRNDGSWRHRNQQKHLEVQSSVKKSRINEEIEDSSDMRLHGEAKGQEMQIYPDMITKDGQFNDTDKTDYKSSKMTAATVQMKQTLLGKSEEHSTHNPESHHPSAEMLSSVDNMKSRGDTSQAIEQSRSINFVGEVQKAYYPSQQMEASLVSDSPPDRPSKTSPYKVSSIVPAADAILSTQSCPTESSNAQPLSSGQFSSQFLAPKESPLPGFSAANNPYPSKFPPPPPPPPPSLSQGTSVAHVPQLHRDYSQRPPYPVQSIPTGTMHAHAYQGPLSNQPSQFPVSQESAWPSLPPPPPRPPYDSSLNPGTAAQGASSHFQQNHLAPRSDFGSQSSMRPYGSYPTESPHSKGEFLHQMYPTLSELPHPLPNREDFGSGNPSNQPFGGPDHMREDRFTHAPVQNVNPSHSFAQGHTHPQPPPPSQELTRIKMKIFSGDNFPSGELLNSSSQIHPHSHNQQLSYGVGDSILGVPGKTGVQYPVGGSILGFPGKDGPMSQYPPDMPDRSQFSQVPDFGASRIQTHHNPYAATFEQPLSFKFSSKTLIQGKNAPAANMFDTPVQVPVDGQGVGSAGSRQTTSSPSSAGAVSQLLRKSVSEQYDPLLDSIEPSGNPLNKHDQSQKHTATNDSNMMVRFSGSCEPLDVEENKKHTEVGPVASATSLDNDGYGETADAEVGVVEDESLSNDDGGVNMAVGEMEIDQVKSGGKSRKKKDSRSTRLFKSAVADFVKDLLKPSWRQGNMSKEAFKTIVKKTVDKVSGAMKSHQIPKSEAKINHYIDSSQRKLTKLVMGYVDKYVKPPTSIQYPKLVTFILLSSELGFLRTTIQAYSSSYCLCHSTPDKGRDKMAVEDLCPLTSETCTVPNSESPEPDMELGSLLKKKRNKKKRCKLESSDKSCESPSLQSQPVQLSDQEASQPLREKNITITDSESLQSNVELSLSTKKKKKKGCETSKTNDTSCESPFLQPPLVQLSDQQAPQPLTEKVATITDSEIPQSNVEPGLPSKKKKKKKKKGCETSKTNDTSCESPFLQPPLVQLSDQQAPQPLTEKITTITDSESPQSNVELSFPQNKNKKRKKKKGCKTPETNNQEVEMSQPIEAVQPRLVHVIDEKLEVPQSIEDLTFSVKSKKRNGKKSHKLYDCKNEVCGVPVMESKMPAVDPCIQPCVEISLKQLVAEPLVEGISTATNSKSPNPNADFGCSQETKKKKQKRSHKTNEDEELLVETIMAEADPSFQPSLAMVSEQEAQISQPLVEGMSRTVNSENLRPNADFNCSQETKKKNRKRGHKTSDSLEVPLPLNTDAEPHVEGVSVTMNSESHEPNADISCSQETKKKKRKRGHKTNDSLEVLPPLNTDAEPHVEGVSMTMNSESLKPNADISCSQKTKKKKQKRGRKTSDSKELLVKVMKPETDPSLLPLLAIFSEHELEVPPPLNTDAEPSVEGVSVTMNSDSLKPNADINCSQETKKKKRKRGRKASESKELLVEVMTPKADPSLQPLLAIFSEHELEVPPPLDTDAEPMSVIVNSESPKPNADISSSQETKKKNRKRKHKTSESKELLVEVMTPDADPSLQPILSEKELEVPLPLNTDAEPLLEGMSTTMKLGSLKPNADISCSQETKKKDRKRKRKTSESKEISVEILTPEADPSLQPSPAIQEVEVSPLHTDAQPLVEGVSTKTSETPKPSAAFGCSQEKKKKYSKRKHRTNENKELLVEVTMPDTYPSLQSPVSLFSEQKAEVALLLNNGTELKETNIDEVPSLSHLSPIADSEVVAIGREGNLLQISNSSPERSLLNCSQKKLLILDINGLLADIVQMEVSIPSSFKPDKIISRKAVFKRPFCDDFLQFCFDRFNVGVWSSRTKRNVDIFIDFLLGDSKHKLLFCWNQSHCTSTRFKTEENKNKPLVLKELRKLWEKLVPGLPWARGEYTESNTLLLDDSPYKALRNPVNTAIFPTSYQFRNRKDSSLGPGGDIRSYLEGLAMAENVQKYVEQNPYGQQPITESNPSWNFYRRVIEDVKPLR